MNNYMNMSPNDFIKLLEKKDTEINRLKKIVAKTNENIKIVGRQNTRLKKKCDRYQQKFDAERLSGAKLVVTIKRDGGQFKFRAVSVFDNRTRSFWTDEQIHERGIERFLNFDDLKETLNWNLNGDGSKFRFRWCESGEGRAYIFH